jgi:hypothetical protein
MKPRFEVDDKAFQGALRKFQANSKRSVTANLKQQAKLLVVELVGVTPPNKKFEMNKKGGEQTVKNDLAKLFAASRSAKAEKNLAGIHKAARNRRGRVPKGVNKVQAANLVAYRKQMLARVGRMAAGWKNAATSLGAKLPAWITRHSRPGFGKIKTTGRSIEVELSNQSVYSGQKGWVERGVKAAMKKRYWAMIKRVDFAQKQAAQQAGLQVK